jgi:hypothetical protein
MMNDEVLELFHTRLMTLELIVSELHETLIDRGLINKDEFNSSLDDKIKKVTYRMILLIRWIPCWKK